MTQIKICGMTCAEDIELMNNYKPNYAGFVMFFPKSKRNLSAEQAKNLVEMLDKSIKSVAVTVSPTVEQLVEIEKIGFDFIQIHGIFSEQVLNAANIPIIRAFNVSNAHELEKYKCCDKICGFLFDAAQPGSGKVFDWDLVKQTEFPADKLIFLAGGLSADNVRMAIESVKPYAVDVSSGVENDSGMGKSPEKVAAFVKAVTSCSDL